MIVTSNKNNFLVNKVQKKIILSTLLMQIFVSALTGIFIYYNSRNIIIENTKTQTISLLTPLQLITQERLELITGLENKKNYLNIILNLQGQTMFPELKTRIPSIKEIYIYSDRQDIHTIEKEPLWIFPKLKHALFHKAVSITFTPNSLFVNVPIHIDDDPLGGIILEYTTDKINAEKQKALLASIILALITFLLSLFLIKIFTARITIPLQNIITDLENVANSGELNETKYNYSSLKDSEFEPLITGYIKMKQTVAQQINELNAEINKRKKAENESALNRTFLAETIDEKSDAIKEINLMLKEEISRRNQSEKKSKINESMLNSLLNTSHCGGVLIINNKGEVIKTNKKLSEGWDLPEEVITNDSEDQLIKYFSYQIINSKKFLSNYNKCDGSSLELGNFELKDSRNVLIRYFPLTQDSKIVGKILTFDFS